MIIAFTQQTKPVRQHKVKVVLHLGGNKSLTPYISCELLRSTCQCKYYMTPGSRLRLHIVTIHWAIMGGARCVYYIGHE